MISVLLDMITFAGVKLMLLRKNLKIAFIKNNLDYITYLWFV